MGSRLQLHTMLVTVLGSTNVYYQPPSTISMKYPAIIYTREKIDNIFADDLVYNQKHRYNITVIDSNPDSQIVTRVSQLPSCRYDRGFKADNLNHDVFILNY